LENVGYRTLEVFGLAMPVSCPGVPSEILSPRRTWREPDLYDQKLGDLATAFLKIFEKFSDRATTEVIDAAPHISELSS
jgi:phosphoenolpyruvate carboxykinase (ATP)